MQIEIAEWYFEKRSLHLVLKLNFHFSSLFTGEYVLKPSDGEAVLPLPLDDLLLEEALQLADLADEDVCIFFNSLVDFTINGGIEKGKWKLI